MVDINELSLDEVRSVFNIYRGRQYIQHNVGYDDYTRWELRLCTIGSNSRGRTVALARRSIDDNTWMLSVAGRWVDSKHWTSENHWEKTFNSYWDLYVTTRDHQGRLDSKGVLICPVLPKEGWVTLPSKNKASEVRHG